MIPRLKSFVRLSVVVIAGASASLAADERGATGTRGGWKQHDAARPKPPVAEPAEAQAAARPPRGAVVLFDGANLNAWQTPEGKPAGWKVTGGEMEIVPGAGEIETKGRYGDLQLHIEWAAPSPPQGQGQDRGNSGIFFMGKYELQVLDSYRGRHLHRRPDRRDLRAVSAAVERSATTRPVAKL